MQGGRYKEATELLEGLYPSMSRNLRASQYLQTYTGILKLKRALRRHDMSSACYLLSHLRIPDEDSLTDPELSFQIKLLQIDYYQRIGSYEDAFHAIEDLFDKLQADEADIYQRTHVMVMKALLWNKVDKPQKGFSVAMRAVSIAIQARLLPALWEAVGVLANILGSLEEYDAQRQLLDAIVPRALGSGDLALCAQLYCWQADACIGLATKAGQNSSSLQHASFTSRAEAYADRAFTCK